MFKMPENLTGIDEKQLRDTIAKGLEFMAQAIRADMVDFDTIEPILNKISEAQAEVIKENKEVSNDK